MGKKSIVGVVLVGALSMGVGLVALAGNASENHVLNYTQCDQCDHEVTGRDLKPVIYLYPTEDDTEISVSLDYDGNIVDLFLKLKQRLMVRLLLRDKSMIIFSGKEILILHMISSQGSVWLVRILQLFLMRSSMLLDLMIQRLQSLLTSGFL